MLPRYELDTLPDPGWPRLFAVSTDGRQELPRSLWGHCIAHARQYAGRQGYTQVRTMAHGITMYVKPVPYPGSGPRLDSCLAHALKAVRS